MTVATTREFGLKHGLSLQVISSEIFSTSSSVNPIFLAPTLTTCSEIYFASLSLVLNTNARTASRANDRAISSFPDTEEN